VSRETPTFFVASVVAVLVAVFGASAGSAAARQQVVVIQDEASCRGCSITSELLFSLQQGGDAPRFTQLPSATVMDTHGNVIVARGPLGPPLAYDSEGRFVRVIGAPGNGPGEFESAEILVPGASGALYVVDRRIGRISSFDAQWQFVRSAPVPHGAFAAIRANDGTIILNADVHDAKRFGLLFHAFDEIGNYLLSFGGERSAVLPGITTAQTRRLAAAREGGIWSAAIRGQYVLDHWGVDGTHLGSMKRDTEWFRYTTASRPLFTNDKTPPAPQVFSILEDDEARIWVLLRVADPEWRTAITWSTRPGDEQGRRPIISNRDRAFDTIIEVIDRDSGALVASQRFDEAWLKFVSANRVLAAPEDENGGISLDFLEVVLHVPER